MSNNPFLKQKNTNNRFKDLASDKPDVSSKNMFLPRQQTNTDVVKPVTKISDTKISDTKISVSKNKKKGVIFEEEFPLLCETNTSLMTNENTFKFTDAVNTVIAEEIIEEAKVLPKWVSYSRQNGTTIVYQGSYVLEKLKQFKEQEILNNSPNTLMKHITEKMQKKWEKFRIDYDSIHGDGSYDQEYILPPVYGPEYELDEDDYYDDNSSNEHFDTNEHFDEYIE
jgi:hypothetical protein